MSWRTVVITTRCKLDYKMGYMVVRAEETKKIFLDELAVLLIENPAVSLTGCLLEALTEKKIKVILCDSKRSPNAELVPYYNSYDCSEKIKFQIGWNDGTKGAVWSLIVAEKIRKQAQLLNELGKEKEAQLLYSYIPQIEPCDKTNREGHAAKVYFNALFGMDFTRGSENETNAALNYGYSIILSAFNREIVAQGYLTQLGIFHDNKFNHFNLSCDLMEPFRILIDRRVKAMNPAQLSTNEKHDIVGVLNDIVIIDQMKQTVLNAIKYYCRSVFNSLNENNPTLIKFYSI